jgi:hypothetical protein
MAPPKLQCSEALRQHLHSDIMGGSCQAAARPLDKLGAIGPAPGVNCGAEACRAAAEQRRLAAVYVATDLPAKQRRKQQHEAPPGPGVALHLEGATPAPRRGGAAEAAQLPQGGRKAPPAGGPYLNTRLAVRRKGQKASGASTQAGAPGAAQQARAAAAPATADSSGPAPAGAPAEEGARAADCALPSKAAGTLARVGEAAERLAMYLPGRWPHK